MTEEKRNLISRRDFFRNSSGKVLPILVMLISKPLFALTSEVIHFSCEGNCEAMCKSSCANECSHGCTDMCTNTCIGKCSSVCAYTCTHGCKITCGLACEGSCKGSCVVACANTSIHSYRNISPKSIER